MIITKTPLRITFAGGGSDMASYNTKHPACCISATINKYVYVLVKKRFDKKIYLKYSDNEVVDVSSVDNVKHDFIRETLKFMNIDYGVEIINWADIPTKGTGLGSSSSFLVGLLLALHTLEGRSVSKESLASQSCYIEIEKCKKPIGVQDQYAAAYGGFNEIEFYKDGTFSVETLLINPERKQSLNDHLMLFFTGVSRFSSDVAESQVANMSNCLSQLNELHDMTREGSSILTSSVSLDDFGILLGKSWAIKKTLAPMISSSSIDSRTGSCLFPSKYPSWNILSFEFAIFCISFPYLV